MPRRDKSRRKAMLRDSRSNRVPQARQGKSKKSPAQIENPAVAFRLSLAERAELDDIAAARNLSRNALLQEIVREFLREQRACKQGTK